MLRQSRHLIPYILAAVMTSCSSNPSSTQNFTAANGWFQLHIPTAWQHELEEGVYTFTDPANPQWAFQISAYKANADTVPAFNATSELRKERRTHPNAKIVTLGTSQFVYYSQEREDYAMHCWIAGGRRCKAFCTFTMDSHKENGSLNEAMKAIASMTLE